MSAMTASPRPIMNTAWRSQTGKVRPGVFSWARAMVQRGTSRGTISNGSSTIQFRCRLRK